MRRTEAVLDILKEVEAFFQPAALAAICKLANEHDMLVKYPKSAAGLCCRGATMLLRFDWLIGLIRALLS